MAIKKSSYIPYDSRNIATHTLWHEIRVSLKYIAIQQNYFFNTTCS
jgi:hypothetical protein